MIKLIRVIIVDDEIHARKAIRALGEWSRWNMDIFEASNGEEAIQLARELHPDLVIMDMDMPIVDGVALLKELENTNCEFIVISGHDDFFYMKPAIAYHVVDYLLKPITRQDLNGALLKAVEKKYKKDRNERQIKVRQLFWRMFWYEPSYVSALYNEIYELYGSEWNMVQLMLFVCSNFRDVCRGKFNNDSNLLIFTIENVLYEFYCREGDVFIVPSLLGKCEFLLIVKSKRAPVDPFTNREFQDYMKHTFGISFQTLESQPLPGLREMRNEYIKLRSNLLQRPWSELKANDQIESTGKLGLGGTKQDAIDLKMLENEIVVCLHSESIDRMGELLHQWIGQILQKPGASVLYVHKKFIDLWGKMRSCLESFGEYGLASHVYSPLQVDAFMEIGLHIESLYQYLYDEAKSIIDVIHANKSRSGIDQVAEYLQVNYTQDYSLDSLVLRFHFSKSYMCKVFKEKYNCTITEYVTKLRMKHARKCIVEKGYLVQEAADAVGINDYSYFSKLYKKYFGRPPSNDAVKQLQENTSH